MQPFWNPDSARLIALGVWSDTRVRRLGLWRDENFLSDDVTEALGAYQEGPFTYIYNMAAYMYI